MYIYIPTQHPPTHLPTHTRTHTHLPFLSGHTTRPTVASASAEHTDPLPLPKSHSSPTQGGSPPQGVGGGANSSPKSDLVCFATRSSSIPSFHVYV